MRYKCDRNCVKIAHANGKILIIRVNKKASVKLQSLTLRSLGPVNTVERLTDKLCFDGAVVARGLEHAKYYATDFGNNLKYLKTHKNEELLAWQTSSNHNKC